MIRSVAARGEDLLAGMGRWAAFCSRIVRWMAVRPPAGSVIEQMVAIGLRSFPVVAAISVFVGTNVVLVGFYTFKQFGGQDLVGAYAGLSCLRELAPVIVGTMMAAKPGTEMTATLATMRVKEQIDALEVMAVNPYWYLMAPRVIAFILVAPALIVFADVLSVLAGGGVAIYQLGVNPGAFVSQLLNYVSFRDVVMGMGKGLVFAVMTCFIACYFGFRSEPGPQGVSRAINRAVVAIATLIVVANYFLSQAMFG